MDIYKQLDSHIDDDYVTLSLAINLHGLTTFDILHYAYLSDRSTSLTYLSKKLGRSVREIEKFLDQAKSVASKSINLNPTEEVLGTKTTVNVILTGLVSLDSQLGGGISVGEITEIFGSSGSGKSQFLLLLALRWQNFNVKKKKCVYISTESPLETRRLESISNATFNTLLEDVICIYCADLENQDHIIQTQLSILLKQHDDIGLVIIDSISHHLRRDDVVSNTTYLHSKIEAQEPLLNTLPEYKSLKVSLDSQYKTFFKSTSSFRNHTAKLLYIVSLHQRLQSLAKDFSLAIVVANQVSDAFDELTGGSSNMGKLQDDSLSYRSQLAFSSGWDYSTISNHIQRTSDWQATNDTFSELMSTFDHSSKRRKMNSSEPFDPRLENSHLGDENLSEYQKLLLDMLHLQTNYTTKKYLPALGYQWSRRIQNRVLLLKTYRPIIKPPQTVDQETGLTYEQLCEGFQMPADEEGSVEGSEKIDTQLRKPFNNQINLPDLVSGWEIERYFKVVSTSKNPSSMKPAFQDKIPFIVSMEGIEER